MRMKLRTLVVTVAQIMALANTANADTVQIDLPAVATYQTIAAAYAAAADGATLRLQDTAFAEDLDLAAPKSVQIAGGYYADFSAVAGNSTVNGRLTISAGSVVLSDIVIAPPVDVITTYDVTATFYEPDTQPNNSIFIGTFTCNSATGTVTNLHGILSESMTGLPSGAMTWLSLANQLSSVPVTIDGINGLLVTTFLLNTTSTFTDNPLYGGTDGWSPGTGFGLYYGFPTPGANPGNAYVRIFVNTADPTAPLTQAQIDKLAYADCSPGGMMGATCMTGTTVAGYGTAGTMSGYPVSLTITKQ
jgi:hypothetical protein